MKQNKCPDCGKPIAIHAKKCRSCWQIGRKLSDSHKKNIGKAHTGNKSHFWKGGRIKIDGYIYIKMRDHPFANKNGYIAEHRLVMEKKIGRYLKANEIAHHKNEIRNDNSPKNLELKIWGPHTTLHQLGRKASIKARQNMSESAKKKVLARDSKGRFR